MLKILRCLRTSPRISARLLSQSGTSCSKKFETGNWISKLFLISSVVDPEQGTRSDLENVPDPDHIKETFFK
jgi:hypothetical protein